MLGKNNKYDNHVKVKVKVVYLGPGRDFSNVDFNFQLYSLICTRDARNYVVLVKSRVKENVSERLFLAD